jgi:hypothetical protein
MAAASLLLHSLLSLNPSQLYISQVPNSIPEKQFSLDMENYFHRCDIALRPAFLHGGYIDTQARVQCVLGDT